MTGRCAYCAALTGEPVFCSRTCAELHHQLGRQLVPMVPSWMLDAALATARATGQGVATVWERAIGDALRAT